MRLINTETLQLHNFFTTDVPKYAILSHRWQKEESTLQEFQRYVVASRNAQEDSSQSATEGAASASCSGGPQAGNGVQKVLDFCNKARADGYEWAWVDTVCIDKTNNSELHEAINSMYKWYRNSAMCFAYLQEITAGQDLEAFARSDWFKRGWTLQELLAPRRLTFYNCKWVPMGTRRSLRHEVSPITGIPVEVLEVPDLAPTYSSAQRMVWAATRQTTREEDIAYCLLGLFQFNMEVMYGEGATRAFRRLQLKILEDHDDESLLTWQPCGDEESVKGTLCISDLESGKESFSTVCTLTGALASKPQQFSNAADIQDSNSYLPPEPLSRSSRGLKFIRDVHQLNDVSVKVLEPNLPTSTQVWADDSMPRDACPVVVRIRDLGSTNQHCHDSRPHFETRQLLVSYRISPRAEAKCVF